jgi:hypothetical protein
MPLRGLQSGGMAPGEPVGLPISHWLRGLIDDALLALGAQLLPAGGAVFRAAAPAGVNRTALAILAIPLGVVNEALCWGEARAGAIERFQLQLIACGAGSAVPHALRVRLVPHHHQLSRRPSHQRQHQHREQRQPPRLDPARAHGRDLSTLVQTDGTARSDRP